MWMASGIVTSLSVCVGTAKRPEKKTIKTNKNKKNNLGKGYHLDRRRDPVRHSPPFKGRG
jgi:hypothetical protein